MSSIIRRIEREAGVPNLAHILAEEISPTDLQSLLMEVYRRRAQRRNPRAIFSDYVSNRFTHPSRIDPALLLEWERVALSQLPEGFHAIELSPVCPFGSVSGLAPISQDWILTASRNMEVVSDPTKVLALECALRRREAARLDPSNSRPVDLASSHRAVRAQRYDNPTSLQHFGLFSLCSAGRDRGNFQFEIRTLTEHARFYARALRAFLGKDLTLRASVLDLSGTFGSKMTASKTMEALKNEFESLEIRSEANDLEKTGYYRNLRFHIYARSHKTSREIELVDGGDTDWTQKLLNNSKERLVISGVGSDRLCDLRREPS